MQRLVLIMLAAALTCGVGLGLGCDDGGDGDVDADTDVDADADADGVTPTVVDSTHTGWMQPTCLGSGCHVTDDHNTDLAPYQCADCHGTNGAPAGHTSASLCGSCHEPPPHGADGFPDPASCVVCHPN